MALTAISGTGVQVISGVDVLHPVVDSFLARLAVEYSPSRSEIDALNNLVWGMASNGILSLMDFVHPVMGSTAGAQALNLLSTSFPVTFFGSWTYASTGMRPTTALNANYATFGYNPSVNGLLNDAHLGVYTRTNSASLGVIMGCYEDPRFHQINTSTTANSGNGALNTGFTGLSLAAGITDTRGYWLVNRRASNLQQLWVRGTLNATTTTASTVRPNLEISYGARNRGTTRDFPSAQEIAFGHGGRGLSDVQARTLSVLIQSFNTALGRQV